MKKQYVITIQSCSSMDIDGFIYVAIVPSKKRAEKITNDIQKWLEHMKAVMVDVWGTNEEMTRLKINPPPIISKDYKWNYENLCNFCHSGCVAICEEVQVL